MTTSPLHRRGFLRATAVGAVSVGGSRTLLQGSTAAQGDPTGKLVFTYDDAVEEDYTRTFKQAHEKEGVPGCSALPSAYVGTPNSLDPGQIEEMVSFGWEVISHTEWHRGLWTIDLAQDVAPGDDRLYVPNNVHGKRPGDRIVIFDGTTSEVVEVAGRGSDETGEYVDLREPVERAYAVADGARERYTEDVVKQALGASREQLESELGVSVTNLIMPFGGYGEQARRLAPDYYTAVANAGSHANGDQGLNPIDNLDLPNLSRRYFRKGEMTKPEIEAFLDRVATEDVIGIFGGHSWRTEELPPERIRWTIQRAKKRDIEIVTLQQALADVNDSGSTTTQTTETTQTTTSTTSEPTTTETTTSATETTTSTTESTRTATADSTTAGTGTPTETTSATAGTETSTAGTGTNHAGTTTEPVTSASETGSSDWEDLGWLAALGGTGGVAAYLLSRAKNGGEDEVEE